MNSCIFCQIVEGAAESSIVYTDRLVTAFMDIQPINPGHLLVVPNSHAAYLSELEPETGAQMFKVAQYLAQAIRDSSIHCEGINLFLADGEAAMQEVFHVHLHVIPRNTGDGFGVTFPQRYFSRPSRQELDAVAEQIKNTI
jgi:histidine triad (HIT) family protein